MGTDEPQPDTGTSDSDDVGREAGVGAPALASPSSPPRRWRRRLLGVGLAVVVLGFVGLVGLNFLGGQVQKILAGHVQFGTAAPNGCDIAQSVTELPAGTAVYWGGYLQDEVAAGTTLVIELAKDGQILSTGNHVTTATATCLASRTAIGPIPAGTYTLRILRGSVEEATGTITIR